MDTPVTIALGICLAAACGFRVFVPFLFLSVASRTGAVNLTDSFAWIGTEPALTMFAIAALCEVAAYYIPWFDNMLDLISTPAAVVAGVVMSAAVFTDMSPALTWALALIAGGGTAGLVQGSTAALRLGSTATTAGMGNATVATGELLAASVIPPLALAAPVVCLGILVVFLGVSLKFAGWVRGRVAR